jgi:hypothetical protein
VFLGTGYHPDDLMHRLAKSGAWKSERYPVVDAAGNPTWPEVWGADRIAKKRLELESAPLEYARQFMCVTRSDAESRFKSAWIDLAKERGADRMLNNIGIKELVGPYTGCRVYTGVDLAVQQHASNDLVVLFTILVYPNDDRQLLWIDAGRWTGPDIVDRVIDTTKKYKSIAIVENVACFVKGTMVLTKAGYKAIETIVPGDLVWTHLGRWRPVKELLEGESRSMTTAKAAGCLPVRTTPNHWFWMREAGRTSGRGGGHHRPVKDPVWVSYGLRDKPAYAAIASPIWPAVEPVLHLPGTNRERTKDAAVDEELALVLGLYMAEGHATRGQVYWTFGSKERYLAEQVARVVGKLVRGKVTLTKGRGTLRVVVSSTHLANGLHIGTGAKKCLPIEWLGWPLKLRLALVRGWLMGDGSASANNSKTKWPSWMLSGASISRNWMMFVRATLAEAGIPTRLSVSMKSSDVIEGRHVKRQPIFQLSFTHAGSVRLREHMTSPEEAIRWAKWWKNDTRIAKHRHDGSVVLDGVHGWSKVPGIEDYPYEKHDGPVFNLVVEEDESYTVEDFIVHNAQDYILQFLRAKSAAPVRSFTTGRGQASLDFQAEILANELAAGKWIIPCRGGLHPEVEAWIKDILYFDPKAHTGDRLAASLFARFGAASAGGPVLTGAVVSPVSWSGRIRQ